VALWLLGYPDQAARSVRDGLDLAATLLHPPSLGHALMWAGIVHYLRRDVPMTLDFGERLIALGNEHGLQLYQAVGRIIRGWALAMAGRVEEGLPELRQGVVAYGAAAKIMMGLYTKMLAEAEHGAGSPAEAFRQLEAAERQASVAEPFWRADVLHRKAGLCRRRMPPPPSPF
jgi:predicted ATPase